MLCARRLAASRPISSRARVAWDHLQLAYSDTVKDVEAAARARPLDCEAEWRCIFQQAVESYEFGHEFASDSALEEAVALYRCALNLAPRAERPFDWAMTQHNLGTALQTLGDLTGDPNILEQAVHAYHAALEEHTRERDPFAWATTQNNLGNALQMLGDQTGNLARLEEAVAAHRLALAACPRECVPLDWATTQNNLGSALATLGNHTAICAPWRRPLRVSAQPWRSAPVSACRSTGPRPSTI